MIYRQNYFPILSCSLIQKLSERKYFDSLEIQNYKEFESNDLNVRTYLWGARSHLYRRFLTSATVAVMTWIHKGTKLVSNEIRFSAKRRGKRRVEGTRRDKPPETEPCASPRRCYAAPPSPSRAISDVDMHPKTKPAPRLIRDDGIRGTKLRRIDVKEKQSWQSRDGGSPFSVGMIRRIEMASSCLRRFLRDYVFYLGWAGLLGFRFVRATTACIVSRNIS